jgi:hypothetical protein
MAGSRWKIGPHQQVYLLLHTILVLVGVLVTTIANEIAFALGTGITATGITGWVIFFYVRQSDDDIKQRRIIANLGIIDGFTARSSNIRSEYEPRFFAARERIDFFGFGHKALREDFIRDIPKILPNCKIRMLMIDPTIALGDGSNFASQRDLEEANIDGQIRSDVVKFLEQSVEIKESFPDRFEIRLYSCFPSINICRIDNEMFWGPYLVRAQSRNMPTLLVDSRGSIFRALLSHYEAIWSNELLSRSAFRKNAKGTYEHILGSKAPYGKRSS